MAEGIVQFIGKELGQHGPNVYYKEFSVFSNGERKNFKLGEFYFVRKDASQPICIAEFQLIWLNLKDGKKLAVVKLYFRPEDTKSGRLSEHGEDELVEADRHVAVYCDQVPSWECNPDIDFGKYAYEGVTNTNGFVTEHKDEQEQATCCCQMQNGHARNKRAPVKVLSFSAYCRYRTCVRIFSSGCTMRRELMAARGAFEVDCTHTKILFSRFKFQHPFIDDFALADNIRIPVFKGRPRKRKTNRVKNAINMKKIRVEKENSEPDRHVKMDPSVKTPLSALTDAPCCQTYRIVSSPLRKDSERNVIYVKLESRNLAEPDLKKENNFCISDMLNKAKQDKDISKADDIQDLKLKIGKISDKISLDFEQKPAQSLASFFGKDEKEVGQETKQIRHRMVKREQEAEEAPSELVKKGKTGTVLDESFFREMRNGTGLKSSEGVDREKMEKILQDSCKNVDRFKSELYMYMKQRGTPIIYVPKVGYTRVDLPKLFQLVVSNGGYKQVTLNHKWKKIYDEMVLATTITSAATCMRRHYERLLLPFEKHLRSKHRQDALPLKTYSVTSQVSQPLVLTIKTIKKEELAGESVQALNAQRLSVINAPVLTVADLPYCPVNTSTTVNFENNAQQTSSSSNSQSTSSVITTASGTIKSSYYDVKGIPTLAPGGSAKRIETTAMYPRTDVLEVLSMTKSNSSVKNSCLACIPSVSVTVPVLHTTKYADISCTTLSQSEFPRSSTVLTGSELSSTLKTESLSILKQETTHNETSKITTISSSSYITASSAQSNQLFESAIQHKTAFDTSQSVLLLETKDMSQAPNRTVPNIQSNILPAVTSDFVPVSSTPMSYDVNCTASQKEVSVITKIQSPDKEFVTVKQSFERSLPAVASLGPSVLKKRRGRPPKYLKNRSEETQFSSPAGHCFQSHFRQHNVHVPYSGGNNNVIEQPKVVKPVSEFSVSAGAQKGSLMTVSDKHARVTDSVPHKTNKGTPVKVYEYIMTTDSMQAKLVKHKQGVITLPRAAAVQPTASNHSRRPNIVSLGMQENEIVATPEQSRLVAEPCFVAGDGKMLASDDLGSMKRDNVKLCSGERSFTSQNASKEQQDLSHLISRNKAEDEPKSIRDKMDSTVKETHKSASLDAENDARSHGQPKSVIVGPPPLVPISKPSNSDFSSILKTNLPSSMANPTTGIVTASNNKSSQEGPLLRTKNGLTHISLIPDYKTMRDSLDVNSLMKPLSKEIDESLEDLRRAADANIPQKTSKSNMTYDHFEPARMEYVSSHAKHMSHDVSNLSDVQRRYAGMSAADHLSIDADPYEMQYRVPSHDIEYHQIAYENDKEIDARRMYDKRRVAHSDEQLHRVVLNDNDRNHIPSEETRFERERRNSAERIHRPNSAVSRDLSCNLHSPSPIQRCNDRNCHVSHDQHDFKGFDHSKVLYGNFHHPKYSESYHEGLLEHVRIPKSSNSQLGAIHTSQFHVKEAANEFSRLRRSSHSKESFHSVDSNSRKTQSAYKDLVVHESQYNIRESGHHADHSRDVEHSHYLPLPVYLEPCHSRGHAANESLHDRRSVEMDQHSAAYHASGLLPSYQFPNGIHPADYHHVIASAYSGRGTSPPFEHKHSMTAGISPPASVHPSWYDYHHHATSAANNAMLWQQQVHH